MISFCRQMRNDLRHSTKRPCGETFCLCGRAGCALVGKERTMRRIRLAGGCQASLSEKNCRCRAEGGSLRGGAMAAMEQSRLRDILQHKFVYPENIAQAFQYASTESVDAAFCALSSALSEQGKKGCYFEVAEAPPIVQGACVLIRAKDREAVKKFANFLNSPEANSIKKKYGYK